MITSLKVLIVVMTNCKSYYNVKDSTLSISKNLRRHRVRHCFGGLMPHGW